MNDETEELIQDDQQQMEMEAWIERQRALGEALDRAERGNGSPDDWILIRWECGQTKGTEK